MKWRFLQQVFGVAAGAAVIAFGVSGFLVPGKIAAGGASGLAIIIHYLSGLPVGLTVFLLNVPLFLLGWRSLGRGFLLRAIVGTVVCAALIDIFDAFLPPLTHNPMLAAIYSGVVMGLGVGIVVYFRGSTGGTDLVAQVVRKYSTFSVGKWILVFDSMIIAAGGIVFGVERALYALISLAVLSWMVDFSQEGFHRAKAVLIISERPELVSEKILNEMERGVTAWQGEGMYTRSPRQILLCVVLRREVFRLKQLVKEVDPWAFVLVTDAYEVLGQGFSLTKEPNRGGNDSGSGNANNAG